MSLCPSTTPFLPHFQSLTHSLSPAATPPPTHTLPAVQFNDEFVAKHYPQFESAEDLRTNLISSTSLARMKDVEAQIQDAIVTQVGLCGGEG